MSILSDIRKFKRGSLKKTETSVRTHDGKRYIEKRDGTGTFSRTAADQEAEGWTVDLTPVLQLAEVRPSLLIGPSDIASDLTSLRNKGITHIVSFTSPAQKFPDSVVYHIFPTLDISDTDVVSAFDITNAFIQNCLDSHGRIFVQCDMEDSMASVVAAAYLIKTEKLPASAALDGIKKVLPAIAPKRRFLKQLKQYESHVLNQAE